MKYQWILIHVTFHGNLHCEVFRKYSEMRDFIDKKKLFYDYNLWSVGGFYYFKKGVPS